VSPGFALSLPTGRHKKRLYLMAFFDAEYDKLGGRTSILIYIYYIY